VIVLDMMLPGMNGYQVIEKLKQEPETGNIPILIMSSSSVEQGKGNQKHILQIIPILEKPVQPGKLISSVETLLINGQDA
jgi:putative two-component system response regulator